MHTTVHHIALVHVPNFASINIQHYALVRYILHSHALEQTQVPILCKCRYSSQFILFPAIQLVLHCRHQWLHIVLQERFVCVSERLEVSDRQIDDCVHKYTHTHAPML